MSVKPQARISRLLFAVLCLGYAAVGAAQQSDPGEQPQDSPTAPEPVMTADRLGELIVSVDENAVLNGSTWLFSIADLQAIVVYDINADRMRILIPVGPTEGMEETELIRLMQANFDSALDARYAIAQGTLWGAFIHPLSTLTDEEFLVGIGQTANVVKSYGTSYSSGLFIFGSGDSAEIERQRLIEELKEKTRT